MEKNYHFLDIEINKPIYRKLSAIQYDNNSRYILVSVYSNFKPYDLTYATVKIYGIKKDKTVFFNNAKILDAKAGKFEIDLTEQCLAVVGDVEIQILILGAKQERLSSNSFILNVKKTIINPIGITSRDEWGILFEGLANLAEYDIYKNNVARHDKEIQNNIKMLVEQALKIKNIDENTVKKENLFVNIKDFGAIGDWKSHKASEFYNSLEELRAVYPSATSLDEEIDSLALEKALENQFREIYIPYGGYMISKSFELKDNQKIRGSGKVVTQFIYDGDDSHIFYVNGHNVSLEGFKIEGPFSAGEFGTNSTVMCIKVNEKSYCSYTDLFIIGFNIAIDFGENTWCNYLNKVRVQNCNIGINGNGEFNNILINQCNVTYCKNAIYAGGGRNIIIQSSDIERNEIGITKINNGDIVIRENYFEFNRDGNIFIKWGQSEVHMAIIEGNSFFTDTIGEPMISYHTSKDSMIVIRNNNFESYQIHEGIKVKCLTPLNNTLCAPIFENNRLNKDYIIGVDPNKINQIGYYKNGYHIKYSSNIKSDLNNETPSVRFEFVNLQEIELPSFKDMLDSSMCFKILAFKTHPLEGEYMTISTKYHNVVGENKILPNQIYSIYFNRIYENKEEIILAKG